MANFLEKLLGYFEPEVGSSHHLPKEYLAFDLEITKIIPEDATDWNIYRPFGISCAATATSNGDQKVWYGRNSTGEIADQMDRRDLVALVDYLITEATAGKTIVTWNGLLFDFDVLAEESGLHNECKNLALEHIDMMFHLFCLNGYPLALDKAAKGMGLPGKPANVNGALAPKYWAEGRKDDVLKYVLQDATTTLDLFLATGQQKQLRWQSNSNRSQTLLLQRGWLTVNKALELPLPDTSWMNNPWPRKKFTVWLNKSNQNLTQTPITTIPSIVINPKMVKPYTLVFRRKPRYWWTIRPPTQNDEIAMSRFLSNISRNGKYIKTPLDLAMFEIALTFGGTNITISGKPPLEPNPSIEAIENILNRMPHNMIMEIWYTLARVCPEWGPDISENKDEEKDDDIELSEASVGLADYVSQEYYYYDDDNYEDS